MATLSIDHEELYKEVKLFLLGLFGDPSDPENDPVRLQIIKSTQNNQPLPENAIVMQFLFDSNMDEAATTYDPPEYAIVQNSVQARMQLSFYGAHAEARSRIVANLWKNYYGSDNMTICKPLYVQSRQRLPYINDSNNYEDRFILDLALQYNPYVTHAQDFTQEARVTIKPIPEH